MTLVFDLGPGRDDFGQMMGCLAESILRCVLFTRDGPPENAASQEKNSDVIAAEARDASPKGAARMQAEMSAQILKSLSQLIRLNTQSLKLQSEQLAMSNKDSKAGVANYQKVSRDLGSGFSNFNPDMKLVRF